MAFGVYQIELGGKRYVGSTTRNFNRRWSEHLRRLRKGTHYNVYLQRAFDKYGEANLKFSILETVEIPEEVIIAEQKYIDELKPEYNTSPTAGNTLGYKFTDEAKRKISESLKGKNLGNKFGLGSKRSEEHILKIKEANRGNKYCLGYKHSKETRLKVGMASKGRVFTEEHKRKIGEATKGNKSNTGRTMGPLSEETKQKLREAHLGKHLSDEHKRKLSEAGKRRVVTEETRKKLSAASKGQPRHLGCKATEESKQRMREAQRVRREKENLVKPQEVVNER